MQAPGVPQRAAHSQPERYQNRGQARAVTGINRQDLLPHTQHAKRSHSLERGGATRPGEGWGGVQEISGRVSVQGRASGSVDGVEALRVAFAGADGASDRIFPVHTAGREGVSARDARDYHPPNLLAAPPPVHPTPLTFTPSP